MEIEESSEKHLYKLSETGQVLGLIAIDQNKTA